MTSGLVPPHDLEAERAVLAAALLDADAFDDVRRVLPDPSAFYVLSHRRAYEAALAVAESGATPDLVTVAGQLQRSNRLAEAGGTPALADITAAPAVAQPLRYAETVRDYARRRAIIAACQKSAAEGYGTVEDIDQWARDVEGLVFGATAAPSASSRPEGLDTLMRSSMQRLGAIRAGQHDPGAHPTGFVELDARISGLYRGDLVVPAGRPGMGKSAFVLALALNVARDGEPVAFCSLEMPRWQLATRLVSIESGVDHAQVRTAALDPEQWKRVVDASHRLAKLPIHLDDTPGIGVAHVQSVCRQAARKYGKPVAVAIVDYIQKMRGRREKGANREQEVADLSGGLKNLAMALDCCVVAPSQLNRSVETRSTKDKRPQLSDLRESGAIEQDADTVLFLYRDEYYDEKTKYQGLVEVDVAKQRNGATGRVFLGFDGPCMTFHNLERGWQ